MLDRFADMAIIRTRSNYCLKRGVIMKNVIISCAVLITALFACSFFLGCGLNPGLTAAEKKMPEAKYYNPEFSPLPEEVEAAFANGPVDSESALKFEDLNDLLEPGYLETENGYCLNDDGTGFVAAKIYFPGADGDMIQWWFWWHANKNIRYKIWCPGDHYAISVRDKDQANNTDLSYEQRRVNNVHYPWEDTGTGLMELSIRFVSPEEFGYDTSRFDEAGVEAAICGVVGYMIAGIPVEHTWMSHLFFRKGDGLEMRSRFWLGKAIALAELRELAITEYVARSLGYHCANEYTHLAEFLPEICREFR